MKVEAMVQSLPMIALQPNPPSAILNVDPDNFNYWSGWPTFDEHFCQFELDQWVGTGASFDIPSYTERRKHNAMLY